MRGKKAARKTILAKYPKLLLFFGTIILAYILFSFGKNFFLVKWFLSLGYMGTFVTGMLYAYGFTASISTTVLLQLSEYQHILLAGLVGGLGALCGDILVFRLMKTTFKDEIDTLTHEKFFHFLHSRTHPMLKKYFIPVLGVVVIASPLPDEIGVSMLSLSDDISFWAFAAISFVLNTLGILIVLMIGRVV